MLKSSIVCIFCFTGFFCGSICKATALEHRSSWPSKEPLHVQGLDSKLHSKFCPDLLAPCMYFLDAPHNNFQSSLNYFCCLPAPSRIFVMLPNYFSLLPAPYKFSSAPCSLNYFLCSLLHGLFSALLLTPWLFWPPFSRLPKTPCRDPVKCMEWPGEIKQHYTTVMYGVIYNMIYVL